MLEIESDEQSPIEEVALTVSIRDDPTLPVLTFRMWVLGLASCASLAFMNQFFFYREFPLKISTITAQIAVLPLGRFMAATLPTKKIRLPRTSKYVSLNPGPFNMKEHVLITIIASAGSGGVNAIYIVNLLKNKNFYDIGIHPFAAWLLAITTQLIRMNYKDATFNQYGYDNYSKLHMSTFFAVTYGISFATLPATLSHVFLFHGKETWQQTKASLRYEEWDIHTKLMKRNYRAVPHYWFVIILVLVIGLAMFVCEGFGRQLQLPWWGVILACGIAFSFTLPIGVIQATTNQQQDLGIISQYIIGYLYPGRPFANRTFTIYTYVSITQALTFLYDFKLAHYMKIPPRSMFLAQLVGTAVAATVYFENAWWKLGSVDNLCDRSIQGNVWTCPNDNVFFSVSIIWGLIGPQRIFSNLVLYSKQNWFFLVGALAPVPVWVLSKMFPHKKWIHLINMPIFLGATLSMPPAGSVNFIIWGTMGFIFNYVIFRKYRQWWSRYNYILSGALDGGTAFMGILCYFTLQLKGNQNLKWWGGTLADDHCPFATYPTAPGVVVDGCPVFY